MPSPTEITVSQLARLIGLPSSPLLIDVRTQDEFEAASSHLIPGSLHRSARDIDALASLIGKRAAVIICSDGGAISQGLAAWLRHAGITAETLDGGFSAWQKAGLALIDASKLPVRDAQGRTVWVTRARPKVDRIACPWLIRRFIDPEAVFLFVAAVDVLEAAKQFSATPFDIPGVFWSHRDENCSFDTMIEEFGLAVPALDRLATIVRGADTARPDLAPEAPGLLAASLGFSRIYRDDLEQLAAAMSLYDAFYRWARDATDETHTWTEATGAKA
jgi:rhodanese-related sulfurtransferase